MCIFASPATPSTTLGLVGRVVIDDEEYHTLVYQMSVRSHDPGPNAMLLYVPAQSLDENDFIDTSSDPDFLKDMIKRFRPKSRSLSISADFLSGSKSAAVFDKGRFTFVVARDGDDIPVAMSRVPESRRGNVPLAMIEFTKRMRPNCYIILVCWSGAEMGEPDPIAIRYKPMDPTRLFFPAMDSHDGSVPAPGPVRRDHEILVGDRAENMDDHAKLSERVVPYGTNQAVLDIIPSKLVYRKFNGFMENGDFVFDRTRRNRFSTAWGL